MTQATSFIRRTVLVAVLVSTAWLLAGCASGSGADRQLQALQAENSKLRTQLAEAKKAAGAGYDSATQAVARAGVSNQPCTVVAPNGGEPQLRAGAVHGKLRLSSGLSTLAIRPSGGRAHGVATISAASCEVGRR